MAVTYGAWNSMVEELNPDNSMGLARLIWLHRKTDILRFLQPDNLLIPLRIADAVLPFDKVLERAVFRRCNKTI